MKTSKAVSVYLMGCEARGLAKATVDQYRWALLRMVADCRGIPKRGKNLLPALADQSLSQETRNDLIKCWRTFFRCYVRQDWPSNRVLANPVEELDALPYRRRIPGVLKRQEVCKLLTVANTERDRMMVLLVMDCGLRVRELASLRWTDVRDDHLVVNGKVGDRVVPISRSIRDQLESQGNGFHVWMGKRGPLTRAGIKLAFQRLFARSGIGTRKAGSHCLRHTFATPYISAGGSLWALREIMGHTRLATTQIYVTLARTQVHADHARYSPVATMGLIMG